MGKRICAYCGKPIPGYPHVTVWDEQQKFSKGIRFHTLQEMLDYYLKKLRGDLYPPNIVKLEENE